MSQRSIVEFNHDLTNEIDEHSETFARHLVIALASGSDESWEGLKRFGIRRIVQCHHSDNRKIVTDFAEYEIP